MAAGGRHRRVEHDRDVDEQRRPLEHPPAGISVAAAVDVGEVGAIIERRRRADRSLPRSAAARGRRTASIFDS